jgi:AmmeMemoRadiSam system protein B
MKRKAAVAGAFYPGRCHEIRKMFAKFTKMAESHFAGKAVLHYKPRAIIVPHAGYIYSGFTANIAYKIATNSKPGRVIVIGPSHRYYFEGISAAEYEAFQTPCGDIPIDKEYIAKIEKYFPVKFVPQAHQKEHSTEVQMPFIKYYFPNAKVVEIVYGKVSFSILAKLIYALMKERDNLIVISTDLSHFYTLEEAKQKDNVCLNAIVKKEPSLLDKGCEACGMTGLKAILEVAKKTHLRTELLDYRTSADASGDTKSVVGYVSALVG